ncbi:ABC transporter permease [Rickettsiales bacterium]|nr:ABC transporter permease [Rickettsiales bacterium]
MQDKDRAPSEILQDVAKTGNNDKISLFEIKLALQQRGFGILMLIFALPLSIPIPVPPGFTTVFALPLIVFSIQMIYGADSPWMPKWLGNRSIARKNLAVIIEKTAPILQKVERWMQPRLFFISSTKGERFFGLVCLLCSLSIAIPLPLTNFIPAGGIALMSLGLMSKDGVVVCLGILVGAIGLLITFLVIFLGPKIIMDISANIFR